ncbi:MAG: hypothetical protein ACXWZW_08690 [Solirubrobacterales bacterium]
MDPGIRSAILGFGIAFCALFALMTISVAVDSGISILTVVSLLIVGMIATGLIGAIRNPPPDE